VERRDPSELLSDSDEEEDKGGDGYSGGGHDDDESSSIGDSESDEAIDGENNDSITEILQAQHVNVNAETANEWTEGDLDDDQMMAMDDQLAMMFKDRASEKKSKGAPSRIVQATGFDEHRRGSTERSHTFQEPHHGSS
jgi:DNA polymerase phi